MHFVDFSNSLSVASGAFLEFNSLMASIPVLVLMIPARIALGRVVE